MTDAQKSDQIQIAAVFTKNDTELMGGGVQHENIVDAYYFQWLIELVMLDNTYK